MAPQVFLTRSLETVGRLDPDYKAIAGPTVNDPKTGYQAVLYRGGYNASTGKRDYVLHLANTNRASDTFEQVSVSPRQVDFDPDDKYIQVDRLELSVFQGVGSLTLEHPFRSV